MTRTKKIFLLMLLFPAAVIAGILLYVITWEYEGAFRTIAFSGNGDALLSLENGTEILLWDVSTGRDVRAMRKPYFKGAADYIAFSPDGRKAVSGGTDGIILWDIETGKMRHVFEGSCPPPTKTSGPCVAFSPDGRYIVSGDSEENLKLWKANDYSIEQAFVKNASEQNNKSETKINCLSFSPDGRQVLTAGERLVLWDIATGRIIRIFTGHKKTIISAAFTSDNRHVVSGGFDQTLKTWSLDTGQEISSLRVDQYPQSIAFSPDGCYALTGEPYDDLKVWDMKSGLFRFTLGASRKKGVFSIAVSPDGDKAAAGQNGKIELWDLNTGKKILTFKRKTTLYLILNDLVWSYVKI